MPNVIETVDATANTATAYTLNIGDVVRGRLSAGDSEDWYRIDLVAGRTYTFAMIGTGVNDLIDPYLLLRNGDGAGLVADDDSGPGLAADLQFVAPTTGTYYLVAQPFSSGTAGQYGLSVTEGSRAHYDVEMGAGALDQHDRSWSSPGAPATVTFGFRATTPSDFFADHPTTQTTFSRLTAAQRADVLTVMRLWSDAANINLVDVNPGGFTDNATILFSNYNDPNDGAGAFAFYPGSTASSSTAGDVYLDTHSVSTTSLPLGSFSHFAILHEVGHALGLAHPGEYNAAPGVNITYASYAQFSEDSHQYSVMSYFDESDTGARFSGHPFTPLMHDIYALQQLYGANTTTRTGNDTYGIGSTAGPVYDFLMTPNPAFCIWDAAGLDTLNCSSYTGAQTIDLREGSFSDVRGFQRNVSIAIGAVIENAVGGSGNDRMIGNAANNSLSGGGGADTFLYTGGLDTWIGGTGTDTADFSTLGSAVWVELHRANVQALTRGESTLTGGGAWRELVTLSSVENVMGTAHADKLFGDASDNLLNGGAGNDTLFYTYGLDTLVGGDGVNTADFSGFGSAVWIELMRSGVQALTRDQPVLTGTGTWRNIAVLVQTDNAVGTEYADKLFGNARDNVLNGGGGDDVLVAMGGLDTLIGGSGSDTADFSGFGSALWIELHRADVQALTRDQPTLTGTGAWRGVAQLREIENVVGTSSADRIFGSSGINRIDAGAGDDVVYGGAAADIITGGGGSDRFHYSSAGEGIDVITDFTRGPGGDVIDLRDVLVGYTRGVSVVSDFVRVSASGADTYVVVDHDGGGNSFVNVALLQNNSGLQMDQMVAAGNVLI